MRPQEIIEKKRDGHELTADEIAAFIRGVCDGSWADYQSSALIMAIFIRGLSDTETEALVHSMLHSGQVLDLSDIAAPKVDKHSTGGVGDKTSLVIAPLVASCGVAVPMISGRGLGHTGGTLDKLESIKGYNVDLSESEFKRIISKCGYAMSGQTADIAPADKKLYALRDATATVPYIPLIVASIMSKKLAEGLDALVLDVKTGSGAFMSNDESAKALARAMVETGERSGVRTQAVISDMSRPLGKFVGNAVEVYECIKILRDECEPLFSPTRDLVIELSARMLLMAGSCSDLAEAVELCEQNLANGRALERFRMNVEEQGGDPKVCDDPEALLDPTVNRIEIRAAASGYLNAIDTLAIGRIVCEEGGGRTRAEDTIDGGVGFSCEATLGQEIREGDLLGILLSRHADRHSEGDLRGLFIIEEDRVEPPPLVVDTVESG